MCEHHVCLACAVLACVAAAEKTKFVVCACACHVCFLTSSHKTDLCYYTSGSHDTRSFVSHVFCPSVVPPPLSALGILACSLFRAGIGCVAQSEWRKFDQSLPPISPRFLALRILPPPPPQTQIPFGPQKKIQKAIREATANMQGAAAAANGAAAAPAATGSGGGVGADAAAPAEDEPRMADLCAICMERPIEVRGNQSCREGFWR